VRLCQLAAGKGLTPRLLRENKELKKQQAESRKHFEEVQGELTEARKKIEDTKATVQLYAQQCAALKTSVEKKTRKNQELRERLKAKDAGVVPLAEEMRPSKRQKRSEVVEEELEVEEMDVEDEFRYIDEEQMKPIRPFQPSSSKPKDPLIRPLIRELSNSKSLVTGQKRRPKAS
jgi:chromosome segregation ATPase